MTGVDDPTTPTSPPPPPPPSPGERRLDRPPSDRYRAAPATDDRATGSPSRSPARGIGLGAVAALVGALAIVVLGGVLAISAGLIVTAGAIGYAVAVATTSGAGATMSRTRRIGIVVALAVAAVAVGQVGLWLFARTEGGVLDPVDYLGQTFGLLVPLQVLAAAAIAWWTAH
jgi:hypothetical protein